MKRFARVFQKSIVALLATFLLASCSDSSTSNARSKAAPSGSNLTPIAVAYALGGKGDLTYNDAANRGTVMLRARAFSVREYEPTTLDDYSKGLELLALSNPKIIFCIGFLYDDAVSRLASKFPKTLFVVLDGSAHSPSNVTSIKFNAEEGSLLAGSVAGSISKTKRVAFIGGANIPIINEFLVGFRAGVAIGDPAIRVDALYVGSGGTAFTDPVKGREIALTAINSGSDVIFHAAGSSGNGVIKAAKEKGIYAIGVDVDQSHLAPGTVVTSMLKNFDVAMGWVIDAFERGEAIGGKNLILGVRDGAVSLAPIAQSLVQRSEKAVSIATSSLPMKNLGHPSRN